MPFSQDFRWLARRDHELHEKADRLMWEVWSYDFPNRSMKRQYLSKLDKMLSVRNRLSQDILDYKNDVNDRGLLQQHPQGGDMDKVRSLRRRHTQLAETIRGLQKLFDAYKKERK